MLGCGHGSAFLRGVCERLFATGAPAIDTDPRPDNGRVVRAYRKAGSPSSADPSTPAWAAGS